MDQLLTFVKRATRHVEKTEVEGKAACSTILKTSYETSAAKLWDALTNQKKIPNWFTIVDGDFKQGGNFQVKGNASGKILICEKEKQFKLTWEMGETISWVNVSILEINGQSELTLEHIAHSDNDHFNTYGPGATGIGWDLAFAGLGHYLNGGAHIDEAVFYTSNVYREIVPFCANEWSEAAINAGLDAKNAKEAASNTRKFYLGEA